jgi:uncharacterized UPF0160 family protein
LDFQNSQSVEEEKKKRLLQIQIGKRVLSFLEQGRRDFVHSDTDTQKKRLGPGRPQKKKEDKVQALSIKLAPSYVEYLSKVKFAAKKTKGAGGKIRHIIDSFLKYQKREKEQLSVLKNALMRVKDSLEKYSKIYARKEKREESEKVKEEMEKAECLDQGCKSNASA